MSEMTTSFEHGSELVIPFKFLADDTIPKTIIILIVINR